MRKRFSLDKQKNDFSNVLESINLRLSLKFPTSLLPAEY